VVLPGALCEGVLCFGQHADSDDCDEFDYAGVAADLFAAVFAKLSVTGLAIASDLGIAANALAIASLLHIRGMVSFGGLKWKELGKATLVGAVSGGLSYEVMRTVALNGSRRGDIFALALAR